MARRRVPDILFRQDHLADLCAQTGVRLPGLIPGAQGRRSRILVEPTSEAGALIHANGTRQSEDTLFELALRVFPNRGCQRQKDRVHLRANGVGRTEGAESIVSYQRPLSKVRVN